MLPTFWFKLKSLGIKETQDTTLHRRDLHTGDGRPTPDAGRGKKRMGPETVHSVSQNVSVPTYCNSRVGSRQVEHIYQRDLDHFWLLHSCETFVKTRPTLP